MDDTITLGRRRTTTQATTRRCPTRPSKLAVTAISATIPLRRRTIAQGGSDPNPNPNPNPGSNPNPNPNPNPNSRDVSITVSAHRGKAKGESSYVLNHITTPQAPQTLPTHFQSNPDANPNPNANPEVLISSAVATSCALPGIMEPNQLLAKASLTQTLPTHDKINNFPNHHPTGMERTRKAGGCHSRPRASSTLMGGSKRYSPKNSIPTPILT